MTGRDGGLCEVQSWAGRRAGAKRCEQACARAGREQELADWMERGGRMEAGVQSEREWWENRVTEECDRRD